MKNLEIRTNKVFTEEVFGQMCEETPPLFQPPIYRPLKAAVELGFFSNIGALCLVKRVVGKEPKVVKYPIRC